MGTLERITARLSPSQLKDLADVLDEICGGDGRAVVEFSARGGFIVNADMAPMRRSPRFPRETPGQAILNIGNGTRSS